MAQPLYGLGLLIVAAGVGVLAVGAPARPARTTFAIASIALLIGTLAWGWSLYLRATRVPEFAAGTLPAWPFTTYVLLTIGGLALLTAGMLAARFPPWLAWLTIGAHVLFLAGYLWFKDIPPFVFYLLLLLIGVVVS